MSVWQAIEKTIQTSASRNFTLRTKQPVAGGDISRAYIVGDVEENYFVKINSLQFLDNFRQEIVGLDCLRPCKQLVIPKVIGVGEFEKQSYLILEFINLNKNGDTKLFAKGIAALHQMGAARFGFECNNYIGANRQLNSWSSDWGKFFVESRLLPQLELLFQKVSNTEEVKCVRDSSEKLLSRCESFLNRHSPQPTLVHGDLWQGNYAFNDDGKPVVYDPASYFADGEVDIAMLELFGYPSKDFYTIYYQSHPRKNGSKTRKKIYNLYHLLNHANLFGGRYINQLNTEVSQIVAAT